ncbi:hypothetical protein WN943_010478 [Citrus x changshan-huyou]
MTDSSCKNGHQLLGRCCITSTKPLTDARSTSAMMCGTSRWREWTRRLWNSSSMLPPIRCCLAFPEALLMKIQADAVLPFQKLCL